jgi:hypothetical protein
MAKSILGVHHVTAIAESRSSTIRPAITSTMETVVAIQARFSLTFCGPACASGRVGNGQVTATSFAIASGAGQYWRERLRAHSTEFEIPQERLGESLMAFKKGRSI